MIPPSRLVTLVIVALLAGASGARAEEAQAAQPDVTEPAPAVVAPGVVAAPAPAAASKPADGKDDVPRPSWKLAVGLGAGGAACLLTGIVLGALAKARSNEQEGSVSSPSLYTPDLSARGHEGDRFATVAYIMFGIGGALAIADIVLWVERLRPHKKADAQARSDGAKLGRALAYKPSVSPRVFGLEVSF